MGEIKTPVESRARHTHTLSLSWLPPSRWPRDECPVPDGRNKGVFMTGGAQVHCDNAHQRPCVFHEQPSQHQLLEKGREKKRRQSFARKMSYLWSFFSSGLVHGDHFTNLGFMPRLYCYHLFCAADLDPQPALQPWIYDLFFISEFTISLANYPKHHLEITEIGLLRVAGETVFIFVVL